MSKKIKYKVKEGKFKVKLKSGDDALPLSEGDIRGLLVLGMAMAVGPQDKGETKRLLAAPGSSGLLSAATLVEVNDTDTD